MDLSERTEKIFNMRETGAKYSEIAKDHNISLERVRQIYLKLKELKDNFDSPVVFKKRLSKRIKRALTEYYGSEDILENPQIIADMSVGKILRIKNIGRKSLKEISNALNEVGCIGWRY
jgi:DNA-directed RNA polymerase alpha subunit